MTHVYLVAGYSSHLKKEIIVDICKEDFDALKSLGCKTRRGGISYIEGEIIVEHIVCVNNVSPRPGQAIVKL